MSIQLTLIILAAILTCLSFQWPPLHKAATLVLCIALAIGGR